MACALFTAFTGASGVTIVALGALLYPALRNAGYDERFTLGLITSSGSLGLLFAPALPLILYAVVAQQMDLEQTVSIDQMFIAGILPGLLMLFMLGIYSMLQRPGQKNDYKQEQPDAWQAIKQARWELPLPVIMLGGIYSGYFAVSEAAAVTAHDAEHRGQAEAPPQLAPDLVVAEFLHGPRSHGRRVRHDLPNAPVRPHASGPAPPERPAHHPPVRRRSDHRADA